MATIVREGDVVLMPAGLPPERGRAGCPINFLWMMAAHREDVDRQYGVVNVQPDFAATPSGLDAGHESDRKMSDNVRFRSRRFNSATGARSQPNAIAEGIERQMFWGDRLMVCRLRIAPHTVTAVHSHPHEQITIVERGRVRLHIEGTERVLEPGDILCICRLASRTARRCSTRRSCCIDIFSPVREDFLPEGPQCRGPLARSGSRRRSICSVSTARSRS